MNSKYTKGYKFLFSHLEYEIQAIGSLSGKELIKVNGEALSEKFRYTLNSTHEFQIGEDAFKVDFKMISLMRGVVACRLSIDGQVIKILQADPQISHKKLMAFYVAQVVGSIFLSPQVSAVVIYNLMMIMLYRKLFFRKMQIRELKT
ncbi:hypothetical protein [Vibrio sp. SCSIO 43137]|uniref:hypothetical protein n=1 Tax=Vibrio sp. SCSIO 43137 TaxID=3021011 RepID=UPI002307DD0A|nr:hypothetical protein [Vibrio sp. SCSIO 43137]WCE32078.1 hypothetical protein PK654_16355 [Vibrio sp. SCSIO 43137]